MHPFLKKYLDGRIELNTEQEKFVNSCFKLKTAGHNEVLLEKGDIAKHIYLVVKGCIRIFIIDNNGNEFTRFLIFEGKVGTAFPSFINRKPSAAVIKTITPTDILMLSYEDRQLLYKKIPGWETMDRLGLEQDYISCISRIEGFLSLDAKQRYQTLLNTNPEIILKLPSKMVADYLGISQETLSRLKGKKS